MERKPILAIWPSAVMDGQGGTRYEWEISEDGIDGQPHRVLGGGYAPTLIEAACAAGNATYETWGYAKSMGRLAVIGEDPEEVEASEAVPPDSVF